MFQSINHYNFTINKPVSETKGVLLRNTLPKKKLFRVITTKNFIGQIEDNNFRLIGSAAVSVICVLSGKFNKIDEQTTSVEVETRIQKAFLILWICFVTLIGLQSIISYILQNHSFSITTLVPPLFTALFFRLILQIIYIQGRNISMRDLKKVIQWVFYYLKNSSPSL